MPNTKARQTSLGAVFVPEPEGGHSAAIPALPGCFSEGETLEEARVNIREAAALWLEATEGHPTPTPLADDAAALKAFLANAEPAREPVIEEIVV
jgi:antitoxin HicB